MKILVVGAGAVGGYYGGKLALAGAQVSVVCRSDYQVVLESGYHIESPLGDFDFKPHAVYPDVMAAFGTIFDVIMITTKVLPGSHLMEMIAPLLSSRTAIMLLQNGIHIEAPYVAAFSNHSLISALAFVCLTRTRPGVIFHQGYGRLVLGKYPEGQLDIADDLGALFVKAGVKCQVTTEIRKARWRKLVWNAPFNPLSVMYQKTTAELLEDPDIRYKIEEIMKEVVMLARLDGCELDDDVIRQNIEDTQKMAPYKPSMLVDYEHKRPMEIDAILGHAVEFARQKKVAVPYMELLLSFFV
jgi:2-dehydropantoate 2-reductase